MIFTYLIEHWDLCKNTAREGNFIGTWEKKGAQPQRERISFSEIREREIRLKGAEIKTFFSGTENEERPYS